MGGKREGQEWFVAYYNEKLLVSVSPNLAPVAPHRTRLNSVELRMRLEQEKKRGGLGLASCANDTEMSGFRVGGRVDRSYLAEVTRETVAPGRRHELNGVRGR